MAHGQDGAASPGRLGDARPGPTGWQVLPGWLRRLGAVSAAVLLVGAVLWFAAVVLLRVALVTYALAVALLLTALLAPVAGRLRRLGLPAGLAALTALTMLLGALAATGLLLYTRVRGTAGELAPAVTAGVDELRSLLVDGPLHLDPAQVGALRDSLVGYVQQAAPSPVAGATTALHGLAAAVFVLFAVFFLLKDGEGMWRWALGWAPARRRPLVDGAGRRAWVALTGYTRGTVVIALVDAVLIGAGLLVLGVPLWLSLTLLTFFSAFVPLLGATLAGAAAVLVTLVTNDLRDAVIVLVIVLAVQQVEGNVLQPMVMGRAVSLHPLVILVAVTSGTLLLGIIGAVLSVPLTATAYQAIAYVARARQGVSAGPAVVDPQVSGSAPVLAKRGQGQG